MRKGRNSVGNLLNDCPEFKKPLERILELDREQDWWEFDDVPVDSGRFGEIGSYDILERDGKQYRLADPDAVECALSDQASMDQQSIDDKNNRTNQLVQRIQRDLPRLLDEHWHSVAVVGVLVIALVFRLAALGSDPLFGDELWQAWASRTFLLGEGFSNPIGESNPYSRAWLTTSLPIAASFLIFGYTEFAARFPTAIIGTAVIFVWYIFARELYDRRIAIVFAMFLALDNYMLTWARWARDYAVLQLLYVAGAVCFYWWYNVDNLQIQSKYLLGLVGVSLLGFHTHLSYLGLGPVILAFLALSIFRGKVKRQLYDVEVSQPFLWRRFTLATVCFVSGLIFIAFHGIPSAFTVSPEWYGGGRTWEFYFQLFRNEYPILYFIAFVGAAYAAFRDSRSLFFLLLFMIPFAVHSYSPWREQRYIAHLYPAFILLAVSTLMITVDGVIRWLNDWEDPIGKLRGYEFSITNTTVILIVVLLLTVSVSPWGAWLFITENPHGYMGDRSDHGAPTADLSDHIEDEHAVVSSTPHMTMWYLGRDHVDYMLSAQRPDSQVQTVDGTPTDIRTGTIALNENETMLINTIKRHETGWFYADSRYRFYVSQEMKKAVEANTIRLSSDRWANIDIYYWGSEDRLQELENVSHIEIHR